MPYNNSDIEFREADHSYHWGGRRLAGVHEILEAEGFIAQYKRDERALLRGTYVHRCCNLIDRGTLDWNNLDGELVPYAKAYESFLASLTSGSIVASEMVVYSRRWGYAGRLDRIWDTHGVLTLRDIKSGAPDDDITALQTAAYDIAYEEMTGRKIHRRESLVLTSGGIPMLREHNEKTDKSIFICAAQVHAWKLLHNRRTL